MPRSFTDLSPGVQEQLVGDQRRTLRRFSGFRLAEKAIRAGVRQREVPEGHWATASDVATRAVVALVDCACGHRSTLAIGEVAKHCEGCERWFFYDGTRVWAFASPGGSQTA